MTIPTLSAGPSHFVIEAGTWLAMRRLQPNLTELTAEELVQRTQQELVVPLRYGKDSQGVVLIGECPLQPQDELLWENRVAGQEDTREIAQRTLQHWLQSASEPSVPADIEDVEAVLGEAACEWTRREEDWIVPAGARSPVELRVALVPRGLRVEGVLGSGDEYDPVTRQALAEFICRAQLALRFARVEFHEQVRVVAEVDTRSIHCSFGHSLGSVAQASRLLAAEVRALATPELARAYLSDVCGAFVPDNDAATSGN